MGATKLSHQIEIGRQSVRRARLSAALPRHLATIAVLLFVALGLRAAFFAPAAATSPPAPEAHADAPSEDFALQFARAYLSFEAQHPGRRERSLAPFTGDQLAAGAGFQPGGGDQRVRWAEVASDQPALVGGRVITVAASVSSQRLPLYLAITVRHPHGEPLELGGYPSLVGAPAIAPPAESQREAVTDPALTEVIERVMRNYLVGDAPDLRADLSADADITLPTARLRLTEVERLEWIAGPGSGAVLATVLAADAGGATYTLSYELGITYRERPYVDFIEVVPTAS